MVGICGRTGCGKSSLIQALFRIVECDAGKILIDNREIKSIPLRMLREGLAIIPQDPTIFQGTLRFQLDPFIRHTDAELFSVLQMVSLEGYVSQLTSGLNHLIVEGGDNLSQGQRQLICIARSILRSSKILVLDEATSSVDSITDEVIQSVLRNVARAKQCTVLCVAHRLSTIRDFDRILCLENGQIAEFDTPGNLLLNPNSMFSTMSHCV
jgi:ABC-type multidrug transport system fused ATPase/permease subunit